ncbi:MAG TPA: sulfur carrier protein ThiS [Thermoanaerobaculia bacterium]|nr:sulfur carrier protein ThiS [Thermoanaerobaculia bacterium]
MSPRATAIEIEVNGTRRDVAAGTTLLALVESLGLKKELIAVEVNRQLVRRKNLESHRLVPGDRVEILEFVGGG